MVNGIESTSTDYQTSQMSDAAIAWLAERAAASEGENESQPWFLWLAYAAAHRPFHAPPEGSYYTPLPAEPRNLDYFRAMTESMDMQLGRVIDSLTPTQRRRCTIIVITDNGSPALLAQQPYKNRAKGSLYQGGINTAWIISGRAVERDPGIIDAMVNAVDLRPTCMSLPV